MITLTLPFPPRAPPPPFPESLWSTKSVTFFRAELDSLRQVFHAALERKYETLKNVGYAALVVRPPIIYVAENSHYPLLVESICGSLFLPKANLRLGEGPPFSFFPSSFFL